MECEKKKENIRRKKKQENISTHKQKETQQKTETTHRERQMTRVRGSGARVREVRSGFPSEKTEELSDAERYTRRTDSTESQRRGKSDLGWVRISVETKTSTRLARWQARFLSVEKITNLSHSDLVPDPHSCRKRGQNPKCQWFKWNGLLLVVWAHEKSGWLNCSCVVWRLDCVVRWLEPNLLVTRVD